MRIFAVKPKILIGVLLVGVVTLFLSKLVYRPKQRTASAPLKTSVGIVTIDRLEAKLRGGEKIEESSSKLAELVRFKYIHPFKQDLPYNLKDGDKTDFSRGQSKFIEETLGGKRSGFFIDIGAGDGESESISLYLERELKWTGLLVEPDPDQQGILHLKNRKVDILKGCISDEKFAAQRKIQNRRILKEDDVVRKDAPVDNVMCFPFFTVVTALGRRQIDLLTIDIKGRELEVLQTIPFSLLEIELVSVEFTQDIASNLLDLMREHGYKAINLMDNRIVDKQDLIFRKKSLLPK